MQFFFGERVSVSTFIHQAGFGHIYWRSHGRPQSKDEGKNGVQARQVAQSGALTGIVWIHEVFHFISREIQLSNLF